MLIGRCDPYQNIHPDLDLTCLDFCTSVSRQHAELIKTGEQVALKDLGSMNGSFVNGRRLKPDETMILKAGDVCRFGNVEFRFDGQKLVQMESRRW